MITEAGIIYLNNGVLYPAMSEDSFLASQVGSTSELLIENNNYKTYKTNGSIGNKVNCEILLVFHKGKLEIVIMSPNWISNYTSWHNWNLDNELKKKKKNDKLLQQYLGDPPYIYKWGNIESIYDQKSGSSEIIIKYDNS